MSKERGRIMRKGHRFGAHGAGRGLPALAALGLLVLVIGLGLLAGGRVTAACPEQQQAVDKPLQYEVSVVLKLIHVYVTDKKGNPVPDLAASDFIVTDNGQPMTVTDFERRVLRPGAEEAATTGKVPEAAPGPSAAPSPAVRPSGRKFILMFDYAFNNARGIVKAKTAAASFLESLARPEDEIGVFSYSMLKGLRVHEYLTRDHAKVREAVDKIGAKDIVGRASEMEDWYWRLVQQPLQIASAPKLPGQDEGGVSPARISSYIYEAKAQREEAKRMAENYLIKLTALAKSMVFIEGQKHIILFSSGLPVSLVYGAQSGNPAASTKVSMWGQGQFDIGDSVLKARNDAMLKEFSASGCTFFTFDTRESAKGTDLFGWDSQGLETGGRSLGVFDESTSLFKDDKLSGRDFLKRWSDVTGGQYYSNISRYEKNLGQIQNLTGTYYVLGFPINEKWDGKYHEVKVEVKRKGCEVRAQAGYFNPKPFGEYTDLERDLHLFDLALNERALSRMPDRVPMGTFGTAAEGITRIAVLAKLPGEVTAKFSGKRLEFVAIFFDSKGEISDMVREELDPASHRGRNLAFAAGSVLKPGDYTCRLVIRDMDSGMSAVGSAKATVTKPQITGLQLGTPLVLEARTGCPLILAGAKKAKAAFAWSETYPYDNSLFTPVLEKLPAETPSIQVVVPCALPGANQADLAVTAALVNAKSGERGPITIARMDRAPKGPLEILTLEIPTAGIPAGTYYLHFYAQDRATGALGHAFTTLVVAQR